MSLFPLILLLLFSMLVDITKEYSVELLQLSHKRETKSFSSGLNKTLETMKIWGLFFQT